jgi:conjugal transfer pilus assembly protein TraF
MILLRILLLGLLCLPFAAWATVSPEVAWWERSIWDDPDRTYHWYPPDPPPKRDKQDKRDKKTQPRQDIPDIRRAKTAEEVRKILERLRDEAVMRPTEANIRRYLEANKYVMDKSAVFADIARRVIWASPDLDYSTRRPTVNAAIHTYKDQRMLQEERTFKAAMRDYGLFFFLRGDCPYCHQMGPVLKYLEQQYGIEVFPISLDGGGVPGYPNPRPDNGIARVLGVSVVPALYLMPRNPQTGMAPVPVGFGMLAASDIMERIFVLIGTRPGELF